MAEQVINPLKAYFARIRHGASAEMLRAALLEFGCTGIVNIVMQHKGTFAAHGHGMTGLCDSTAFVEFESVQQALH